MTVSKRLRFEILRRDNHTCRYCGASAPDVTLTVDHVIPSTLGGSDQPDNLVAACRDCNSGKSSVPAGAALVDDVEADALRWKYAMEIVQHGAEVQRMERDAVRATFNGAWEAWRFYGEPAPRALDWQLSIDRFVEAGLSEADLVDAVEIAVHSRAAVDATWRYFCGVCWGMISDRVDHATAIARRLAADGRTPRVND